MKIISNLKQDKYVVKSNKSKKMDNDAGKNRCSC